MFSLRICSADGCSNRALYRRDVCRQHLEEPSAWNREITEILEGASTLSAVNGSGVILKDLDLRGRCIEHCILSGASFRDVDLSDCRIQLVYLDFSTLENCSFQASKLNTVVFSGSRIINCNFCGADIVRCNFCGIDCQETKFDESDLYASRFIRSKLNRIGFKDCNLKQVRFEHAEISEADFRYSNTEDAFFEKRTEVP